MRTFAIDMAGIVSLDTWFPNVPKRSALRCPVMRNTGYTLRMFPESNEASLSTAEADRLLADADVVPCMQLAMADAKQLRDRCLAAGFPVALGRDDHCTTGCSPKVLLLARPDDLPRLGQLLRDAWLDMLRAEGQSDEQAIAFFEAAMRGETPDSEAAPSSDAEPPCPACGHVGPLADGCCSDCGLTLG
ncbi:MAG: hypothetical protein SGI86_14080 [Deltaproteobacteria bacterium]|nr:hypothetical protein [Deltaproteobacteria bacterium]